MFDGMPDQFYQFLASRAANSASPSAPASLSLPLSFSLHHHHGSPSAAYDPNPPAFDPSPYSLSPPLQPQNPQQGFLSPSISHLLNHHHPQLTPLHLQLKNEDKDEGSSAMPSELHDPIDTNWSHDEVLALLRIRSSLDNNWFPADITWENVSRKLGELGFKRSADKCKEKFEEETTSFNSSINNANNCSTKNNIATNIQNYSLFGELEDLYNNHHHHNQQQHGDSNNNNQQQCPPPSSQARDVHHSSNHRHLNYEEQEEEDIEEEEDKDEEEEDREREIENDKKVVGDENSVDDSEKVEENTKRLMRKRKRQQQFDMFKGFCENIVNQMMAQQEQLHFKILQDMVKRDEEKIAREEAWKKQEIERIQKEMEVRTHELAIATDRQAKILAFLNKFTSPSSASPSPSFSLESQSLVEAIENLLKLQNASSTSSIDLTQYSISPQPTSSCTTHDQNPNSLLTHECPNMPTSSSTENLANRIETSKAMEPKSSSPITPQVSQNPNENDSFRLPGSSDHTSTNVPDQYNMPSDCQAKLKPNTQNTKDNDTGRRWPRDEVLALIKIRCSLFSNENGDDSQNEGRDQSSIKGIPLWERISQRMKELGHKRSAKRCKEKWENINKYFRKTKDLNKKRSIDSRTCPYFHQLSHLYNQGTLFGTSESCPQVSHLPPCSPETGPVSGAQGEGSTKTVNGAITTSSTVHGTTTAQGDEGSIVVQQVPALDFEF